MICHVLTALKVSAYSRLDIHEKSDDDDKPYDEILRANKNYRDMDRRDCVELRGGYYGKLLLFFRGAYKDEIHDLCLVERYAPSKKTAHPTGMEVLNAWSGTNNAQRTKVVSVKDIIWPVHIVPDFATECDSSGYYAQYLVNHDINKYDWSENKGNLSRLTGKLVTWTDVEKNKELKKNELVKGKKRM